MPGGAEVTRAGGAILAARSLFQAGDGGSIPTSALQVRFQKITLNEAKRLNRQWHSRFPENGGGGSRICFGAKYDHAWYAAAIWTNPTSPKLPQRTWMMLKRFAIASVRPSHTASRMMGWMIREIRRLYPLVQMLVSYSDPATHEGAMLPLQSISLVLAWLAGVTAGVTHAANETRKRDSEQLEAVCALKKRSRARKTAAAGSDDPEPLSSSLYRHFRHFLRLLSDKRNVLTDTEKTPNGCYRECYRSARMGVAL